LVFSNYECLYMQLHLKTKVNQDFKVVFDGFNEELFQKLAPPYPQIKLIRFDGSKPGDRIEIEMETGIKTFLWTSLIVSENKTGSEAYFIDEGQVLPTPLKKWRHKHLVTASGSGAIIHDIIEYTTGSKFMDILLYPLMLLQFSYRKPIYKKEFK
jgi:ligand-binding SRPBCC domain-containing protein